MKGLSRRYKAGIDLGSSKIVCWVTQEDEGENPCVVGTGHTASRGVWGGQLTDVRSLQEALTSVLYETEQKAQFQVRQATVTLNGGFFVSDYWKQEISLSHGVVTEQDVRDLVSQIEHPDYYPVHVIPLEFAVGNQEKIKDPRGVVGRKLRGHFHVIWIEKGRFETLSLCLKRCQVRASSFVFSGYASGLACLSEDERELGTVLVDFGASTATLSFFSGSVMVASLMVPFGGHNISQDVARGCGTQLSYAERLKIFHGAALMTLHDHHETLSLLPMGDQANEPAAHIPRSFLINIIQARCEEIFEKIKAKIESQGYIKPGYRIVFTGGASQLPGLRELAQRVFNCPVRIAKPTPLLQAPRQSADFSSVIGALLYKGMPMDEWFEKKQKSWGLFSWLKEKI